MTTPGHNPLIQWGLRLLAGGLLLAFSAAMAVAEEQVVYYSKDLVKARVNYYRTSEGEVVRHGRIERFHPNGQAAMLGFYNRGQAFGIWSWWGEDGRLIRRIRKHLDFEEILYGKDFNRAETVFKNTAGQPVAEGILKYNQGHGDWIYRHHDGSPKASGRFLTGVPDGKWIETFPDGQLRQQITYKLGLPNGLFLVAYPNGQEEEKGMMEHGLKEGLWKYFFKDGQMKASGIFRHDLEEGIWRYWQEDGKLLRKVRFEKGVAVEEIPLPPPPPKRIEVIENPERFMGRPRLFDEEGKEITQQD